MNTDDDSDSEFWCDICEEEFTESHYHCANCGKVSGMMGHFRRSNEFDCEKQAEPHNNANLYYDAPPNDRLE